MGLVKIGQWALNTSKGVAVSSRCALAMLKVYVLARPVTWSGIVIHIVLKRHIHRDSQDTFAPCNPALRIAVLMTTLSRNASLIADRLLSLPCGSRRMAGIAGPPGSGKSTLAEVVVDEINRREPGMAALFPMDGFHFDDSVLRERGRLANKGAIDTFDVHGLRHMLERLKRNEDDVVAVPVFDRSIEIARAGGRLIARQTGIIVCEGNYLLMRQSPWDRLKPIFDLTVLVEVDISELRRRLRARWEGLGLDEAAILQKLDGNDLPNGIAIMEGSTEPDIRVINN